jgi:VWFA-related protein
LLTKLARNTGGQAYFPANLADLTGINDAIATDLRTVYSIGYYPRNQKKDGTFRAVAVRVLGANGRDDSSLTVRTRTGYIAGRS